MNLKKLTFPFIFSTLILLATPSYSEEEKPESTNLCFNRTGDPDRDTKVKEELKASIQSIAESLEKMPPSQIIEFCKDANIAEDPIDCATAYYSKRSEMISNGFLVLAKGSDCDIFFSLIQHELNSNQMNCFNNALDNQSRFDCLNEFHSLLLGSIVVVRKAVDGATLQDFANDFLALNTTNEEDSQDTSEIVEETLNTPNMEDSQLFAETSEGFSEPIVQY